MAGKMKAVLCMVLMIAFVFLVNVSAQNTQEPEFYIDMNSIVLTPGISASMTLTMINAKGARVERFDGLAQFDILSQSQSSSTQFVNGVTTYRDDVYYTIMPLVEGRYAIKIIVEYNGRSYTTNTLDVNVTRVKDESNAMADIFIKTVLSHPEAYLGEKIVVSWELYTRYSIDSINIPESLKIEGVIGREMPEMVPTAEYVYLDGNRYTKFTARRFIIDPIKTGVFTIPAFNICANVVSNNGMNSGFGSFFRTTTPIYLTTEEKTLTINPLPVNHKPNDFSGIVGSVTLEGTTLRDHVEVGESFIVHASVYGSCNLDGLGKLITKETPHFSVYETRNRTEETISDGQYFTRRDYELIYVPETVGALTIPALSLSYFDPVSGQYRKTEIPSVDVYVSGDSPQKTESLIDGSNDKGTIIINRMPLYGTQDGVLYMTVRKNTLFMVLAGMVMAVMIIITVILVIKQQKKNDQTYQRILRNIKKASLHREMYRAFSDLIRYRFGISLLANTRETIINTIHDPLISSRVEQISDVLEKPVIQQTEDFNKLKKSIIHLCHDIKKLTPTVKI